jgi:hypothetical protein
MFLLVTQRAAASNRAPSPSKMPSERTSDKKRMKIVELNVPAFRESRTEQRFGAHTVLKVSPSSRKQDSRGAVTVHTHARA